VDCETYEFVLERNYKMQVIGFGTLEQGAELIRKLDQLYDPVADPHNLWNGGNVCAVANDRTEFIFVDGWQDFT
jgi:hypothetical protein